MSKAFMSPVWIFYFFNTNLLSSPASIYVLTNREKLYFIKANNSRFFPETKCKIISIKR